MYVPPRIFIYIYIYKGGDSSEDSDTFISNTNYQRIEN